MNDTTEDLDYTPTSFAIADSTGRLVVTGRVPAYHVDLQTPPPGGAVVRGKAHRDTHYVSRGELTTRPANPATLNGAVLSNLPNPATVTINGRAYTVTDGELDMTFPRAGTYAITVASPFPYLDASFSITQ